MRTCPLTAVGALTGPTSAANWQRLIDRHTLPIVVTVIAAIHADTRQPVNSADASTVLDRLERQRQTLGTSTLVIRHRDLSRAITPARAPVPRPSRPAPPAPQSDEPWISHQELIRRTLVLIRLGKLTYDQAADQIGIGVNPLNDLLCDRARCSANTRRKVAAWIDRQRSTTWLANVPA